MPTDRIIITGVSGFSGSHLAECAANFWPEAKIYGFKRPASDLANLSNLDGKITLVDFDLADPERTNRLFAEIAPTKIFHLAAISSVPYSFSNPAEVTEIITIGTINLLEATRRHAPKARFHHCSTVEVFGDASPEQPMITAGAGLQPKTPLGISKAAAHFFAECYRRLYRLDTFVTSPVSLTGPRKPMRFAESSFARQIALIEKGRQEPRIKVGSLDSRRSFLDVRDAARAYCLLMACPQAEGNYLIGGAATLSIREVLQTLIDLAGVKVTIEEDSSLLRPADVNVQIADSSRLQGQVAWRPEIPIRSSLMELLDYWRART